MCSSTRRIQRNSEETRLSFAGHRRSVGSRVHVTITAAAAGTLARLKRALNTTGITTFDAIRSQAVDGFVGKAAKSPCSPNAT
mgnify:CR=1 FL=1